MQKKHTEKVTIRLDAGTVDRLRRLHPSTPYNAVIRAIVAGYLRQKENEITLAVRALDIDPGKLPIEVEP